MDAIDSQIHSLVESHVVGRGFDLVECACHRQGRDMVVRVFVDLPCGGISMGACAQLNKELGALLEAKNACPDGCAVEVFSPGLDRPLCTKNDFIRCTGKRVRLFLNQQVEGRIEWDGILKGADDERVFVVLPEKEIVIPLAAINKAKQVLE